MGGYDKCRFQHFTTNVVRNSSHLPHFYEIFFLPPVGRRIANDLNWMEPLKIPSPSLTDLTDPVNSIKAKMQVGMLRKQLDAQEYEAAAIMSMLEGKGQNLDIRV